MTVQPLGDSAALIVASETPDATVAARVRAVAETLRRNRPAWVTDIVPAFASVAVHFDPVRAPEFAEIRAELENLVAGVAADDASPAPRTIEVPVVYGGEGGPDLAAVAAHTGLAESEVIARHAAAGYEACAIGFLPGFPYLAGLPRELATPRRTTPRTRVPAGSVGIGGEQTGVYPLESPGGWNLIGRTALRLFDAARSEPALLRAGDRVKFDPVTEADFSSAVQLPSVANSSTGAGVLAVIRPGAFTTVQDLGRPGHRAHGVPLGGAADSFALRLANLLVGNAEGAAALEFTLTGPQVVFHRDVLVALGGCEVEGVPAWRPFVLQAGVALDLGPLRRGARGYLAVAGGIDVAPVLGSRGTFVRGGFGGLAGRALRAGDALSVAEVRRTAGAHWQIDPRVLPPWSPTVTLRVVAGAHAAEFSKDWPAQEFKVLPQSDRMGVRLNGEPLVRPTRRELLSAPVAPGTVQVPPDGQPIVLLADAQTIGGYPRMAHVITVDLPRAAQLRPGDTVRFAEVPMEEARELALAQERALVLLRAGLAQKFR